MRCVDLPTAVVTGHPPWPVERRGARSHTAGERVPAAEEHVAHTTLPINGVSMFEYLRNMMATESPGSRILGSPIKLPGSDGAPVRDVAVEGRAPPSSRYAGSVATERTEAIAAASCSLE